VREEEIAMKARAAVLFEVGKGLVMALVFEERVLTGSVYDSARPRIDVPKLIGLYRAGRLKLTELLARTYPFAQISEACAALERGEGARSVVTF
jgi:S-(hydroxymethyl)glutathione dehydrogenase / alcohol dehydrogenase